MSWRDRVTAAEQPQATSSWRDRVAATEPAKQPAPKPKGEEPGLFSSIKDALSVAPGGVGVALGLSNYLDRRAVSGTAEADASKDEGFLDRSGSLLERGVQSARRGVVDTAAGLTGSKGAQDYSQTIGRAANMDVAGDTSWEDVKANPTAGNIGSFVLNRSIESAPLMAAGALPVIGLPTLAVSGTGSIARARADADGRDSVTGKDVAIAAPFGIGSAMLERLGIEKIIGANASRAIARVGQAAAAEGITETLQSGIEYTGGSLGTQQGFRLSEMLDQSVAGGVAGAGMGGGIRTGIEIGSLPFRPVAPGKLEQADAQLTPDDVNSPLDTGAIALGKEIIAGQTATKAVNQILLGNGMPRSGSRVAVTMPTGQTRTGVISDAFDEVVEGETATGVVIDFDDGTRLREHFDNLRDAGVSVREMSPAEEADALDAQMAQMARQSAAPVAPDGQAPNLPAQTMPAPQATPSAFVAPVAGKVTSGFGPRKAPKKGASTAHGGVDYAVPVGTAVASAAPGKVVAVGWDKKGGGNFVKVDHGNGIVTSYAHLKGATVKVGDDVAAGQKIALSGNSGNSTGPHLHFTVRVNGKAVDPLSVIGKDVPAGGVAVADAGQQQAAPVFSPDRIDFKPVAQAATAQLAAPIERGASIPVRAEPETDVAVTANGRELPVRYAVAELRDLTASNDLDGRANPAYPQALQPRDRNRGISQAQIAGIAGNLNPRLIGRSPKASDGAPIVGPDGVVESGNGRTLALQQAYLMGGEKIDAYKQMLVDEGFDINGMEQPVLVRIREGEMSEQDVLAFTREANARDTLDMSATEQAMADANALGGGLLELYRGGDIDGGNNREFVRKFLGGVVASPNDFAKLIDSEGRMSQTAVARVRGAMLAKAYGNQQLVEQAIESTDTEVKSIISALTDVAGTWSKLREGVAAGTVQADLDITGNVNEAVALVDRARREGKRVADLVNQRDIFSGKTVDPTTEAVLRLFFARPDFTRAVSRVRLADALQFYADEAMKAAPDGASLFGDLPKVEAGSVLDLARVRQAGDEADTNTLFSQAREPDAAEQRPDAAARPDAPETRPDVTGRAGTVLPQDGGGEAQRDVGYENDVLGAPLREDGTRRTDGGDGDVERVGQAVQGSAADQQGSDGPDKQDILAVVDANNQVRNAKAPYQEREAFRQGAAFELGLAGAEDEKTKAAAADSNEQFRAGMAAAKKEIRRRSGSAATGAKNAQVENDRLAAKPELGPIFADPESEASQKAVLGAILEGRATGLSEGPWRWAVRNGYAVERGKKRNLVLTADGEKLLNSLGYDREQLEPVSNADELPDAGSELWNDKEFKRTMKAIGDLPHRESAAAADMMRGWRDGKAQDRKALQDFEDSVADTIAEIKSSPLQGQNGYNPQQSYVEGFLAAVTGEARQVRTVATGDVLGVGQAINIIDRAIEAPGDLFTTSDIDAAVEVVDTNPTDAQKEAGNYRKAHITVQGIDITIENPKGSERSGKDPNGKSWSVKMPAHYGYVKRSKGADGEQVDVYIGDNPDARQVFIIDQKHADTGKFDEHKVMLGFPDMETAEDTYRDGFSDGKGGQRLGGITEMSIDEFKAWLEEEQTKPVRSPARAEPPQAPKAPAKPSPNKIVTDERAAELRARLKEKLNPNRVNSGIDPEILAIGAELAVYHIEKGARRFTAFAKAVAADLDMPVEALRKYLRGWYNGARDMMEDMGESVVSMDSADEVADAMRKFADWSTDAPEPAIATPRNEDGLQNDLPASDAQPSAADVSGTAPEGRAGSTPDTQVEGSTPAVRPADAGRGQATQRSGARSERASDSRSASLFDDAGLPDLFAGQPRPQSPAVESIAGQNWVIKPGSLAENRSASQKAQDNVRAIEIVKQLDAEARKATAEEQAAIARYVGWGGLKNAFPDAYGNYGKGFETVGPRLRELLTDEEYETARRSIQYAHYTSETIVRSMWDLAKQLGFKGGKVFEPGMGTGNFAGMMPRDVAANTFYQGIEYDALTARIAYHLYPKWAVRQDDYTRTPKLNDAYDLVIGNPPFSETVVQSDPAYAGKGFVLHDYFFAKSLDAVRPGGLLMFVTSAGTLNKIKTSAREYMADKADLVGAIRLPGNAFAENAGTQVTTDIVVLRKRLPGEAAGSRDWVETEGGVMLPNRIGEMVPANVNRYFQANPDMVLGEQGMFDKLVSGDRYAVRAPKGYDLEKNLRLAVARMPANILSAPETVADKGAQDFDTTATEKKEGSFYIGPDKRLMQMRGGVGVPVQQQGKGVTGGLSAAAMERVKALIPVRDALRDVYRHDLAGDNTKASAARAQLNLWYDAFVQKFGPINKADISYRRPTIIQLESARLEAREEARLAGSEWDDGSFDLNPWLEAKAKVSEIARARADAKAEAIAAGREWSDGSFDPDDVPDIVIDKRPNIDPFADDQEYYRLRAIEHYNDDSGEAKKSAVFFENVITKEQEPQIRSANDALLYVMNRIGRPDIAEIARLAGKSRDEALEELGDAVFLLPDGSGQYQTREQYLSGNVREKLAQARAAADADPIYERNVSALEIVQPAPLGPADIAANLGMPWIPDDVVVTFAKEALGLSSFSAKYNPRLASWSVDGDVNSAQARTVWGTSDREAPYLIADALNRQQPKIYKEVRGPNGEKQRVINPEATQAAQDKVNEIKARFGEWIWTEQERTDRLVKLYNEQYNSLVAPEYDGSYLTTPGIASTWSWRPHQTRVVARIIQSGNTYMAHAVGAGKTSAMIGAGMEMRRLGLVRKPMYVVPNHMLGQFTKEFYEQYPTARIAVADERRFHTSRRKQFVANVGADDLDAVIITHSAFGYIPISEEFTDRLISEQIDEYRDILNEVGKGQEDRFTRRRVEQQIEALEQRLSGKSNRKTDQVITFEEMGVDFLFVDEAHLFRKLDFSTKMGNVKGVDPSGSKMAFDLFAKIRYLESRSPGRAAVLASGTPITNTMAELFSLSRYLQLGELEKRQLSQFDAWAAAFGDTATALEQDPAGGYKSVTRFSKFVNVPELSVMVRQVMDVVTPNDLEKYVTRPQLKGGRRQMVVVEQTDGQAEYQEVLKRRMEAIQKRSGPPKKGDDILLSVIGDGRKSAIDYRLVNASAPREDSKLEVMIDSAFDIWAKTKRQPFHAITADGYSAEPVDYGPATQMIFSDFGINGEFPVQKYIAAELARRGVPKNEIAIIADYKSHVARQRLFNDMNDGKVRFLIGSVAKMGTGVNAQKRLYAVHNMDPQWYPANDEQRNGRIIRQGNLNPIVEIRDYSTKGTYDSQMWQLMETKARFIEGFMRGDPTLRDMDDLGEASQYEQAKAMTTSDPRIMRLTELKQDLEKALRRRSAFDREITAIRNNIDQARFTIERQTQRVAQIQADIAQRQDISGDTFSGKVGSNSYDKRAEFGEAVLARLDDLASDKQNAQSNKTFKIGEVGGFQLVGDATFGPDGIIARLFMQRNGDLLTQITAIESAAGLVSSISSKLRGLESDLQASENKIAQARKTIEDFTPQLDRQFTGQGEIRELQASVAQLEAELEKETKPVTATVDALEGAEAAEFLNALERPEEYPGLKESRVEDRDTLPTITVRVADWGKLPSPGKSRLLVLRARATRWYNGLVGTSITSSDGRSVKFNATGQRKTLRAGESLLMLARAIPKIIERGKLVSSERSRVPGMKAAHRYAARVRDENGNSRDLVVIVREADDGSFHYSLHNYEKQSPDAPARAGREARTAFAPALEGDAGDSLNLMELVQSDNSQSAQVSVASIMDELRARMAQLGIQDAIAVRVSDSMGRMVAGNFDPANRLITIALNSTQPRDITLNHEAVHAMRELGLFRDLEWQTLSKRAKADYELMRSVKRRYPDLDAEAQIEEVVADMFAAWVRQKNQKGMAAKAFERVRDFFEALRSWLRGQGWMSAGDVMRAMDRGDVGGRTASSFGSVATSRQSIVNEAPGLFNRNTPPDFVRRTISYEIGTVIKMWGALKERLTGTADQTRSQWGWNAWRIADIADGVVTLMPEPGNERRAVDLAERLVRSDLMAGTAYIPAQPEAVEPDAAADPERAPGEQLSLFEGALLAPPVATKYSIIDDARASMLSATGKASPFKAKAADMFDRWRTALQDRYLPLLRTQEAIEEQLGRPLRENENPYLAEELMTGRIGARLETLSDDMVDPLFEAMHAEGVDVEELETYLYARHAEERNARIAEINPEFVEGTGSGMSDIEAQAILNRIERSGRKEALDCVARMVDRIRDYSVQMRVDSGLLSKDEADAWKATYKHYVPLRGRAEVDADPDRMVERINRSGGGINVQGKESRRAFGRRSKADSILAYTILQAEEAIVRAETNKAAQKFYNLAKNNPDPDFWATEKVTRKPVLDQTTGLVRYESQTRLQPEDRDWTVTAKFGGEERRVTMNRDNAAARRLADAMKNLTQHQTDLLVHYLGMANRFLSAVNTSYNPEFVITNAFRDIQTAAVNLAGFDRDKLVSSTLKDYKSALVASMKGAFKKEGGEWGRWYREFVNEGGRVYFNQIDDLGTIKDRIEVAAKAAAGGDRLSVKRMFFKVRDVVEASNNGVENAIRLAAYKNAREAGMSKTQAASLAKNLTVNFNRRGTFGPAMNAAYLFFNASIQGSARIIMAMRSPRVRKILAGVVISGAMIELLNAMLSGDDDDGESYYDKISDFDKSRNLILMLPGEGGRHIKIPLPYGYNAFFAIGRTAAEIMRRGGDRGMQSLGNLATTIVDAFNPIGGTESLLNFISPTIADPIVDLERNRDFTDKPILPEQSPYAPPEPDAQRYYSSVGTHWRTITDFLSQATGGDEVVAGAIDVSPETLEHLAGVVVGAAGSFFDRNISLVTKAFDGEEEVEANDLPFVRKIIGQKPGWYDKAAYYDRVGQIEQVVKDAKDYAEREEWAKFDAYVDRNTKLVSLEEPMKAAQKEMRAIRKARAANEFEYEMGRIDEATYKSERSIFKDAEKQVVSQFNAQWNAVMLASPSE